MEFRIGALVLLYNYKRAGLNRYEMNHIYIYCSLQGVAQKDLTSIITLYLDIILYIGVIIFYIFVYNLILSSVRYNFGILYFVF